MEGSENVEQQDVEMGGKSEIFEDLEEEEKHEPERVRGQQIDLFFERFASSSTGCFLFRFDEIMQELCLII